MKTLFLCLTSLAIASSLSAQVHHRHHRIVAMAPFVVVGQRVTPPVIEVGTRDVNVPMSTARASVFAPAISIEEMLAGGS